MTTYATPSTERGCVPACVVALGVRVGGNLEGEALRSANEINGVARVAPVSMRHAATWLSSVWLVAAASLQTEGALKGIPTEYARIRFRSRLEATWAAFFDLLGWSWGYEPFDLNGYIPDFVISAGGNRRPRPILIEVKPESSVEALSAHIGKIIASGWKHDAVIVGDRLFTMPVQKECGVGPETFVGIGHGMMWQGEGGWAEESYEPWEVTIGKCGECSSFTFDVHECELCIRCGYFPSDAATTQKMIENSAYYRDFDISLIEALWATAKNRVQWKGEFGA